MHHADKNTLDYFDAEDEVPRKASWDHTNVLKATDGPLNPERKNQVSLVGRDGRGGFCQRSYSRTE